MGLEEFETGVFSELKNIVEMYMAIVTHSLHEVVIIITVSISFCCRDLSFNKVNTLSALSFVNLPRLQRLYVRQHNHCSL